MKEPIWITSKIPASELDSRTIELRVATRNKELRGKGRIRIQPHRATSGLFCLWVDFDLPESVREQAGPISK